MATSKDFRDFILEQLREVPAVTCRSMMGEYLLYSDGLLFGGIYDERLLVKRTEENAEYGLEEVLPYEDSKTPMYYVEDVDNAELLAEIIKRTCERLGSEKR